MLIIITSGMSPMGWVNKESKGNASPALKTFLFRPGDNSVLPITPTKGRSGQSPLVSSTKSSAIASARMKYLTSHAKSTTTARKGIDSSLFSPSELVDRGVSALLAATSSTFNHQQTSSQQKLQQQQHQQSIYENDTNTTTPILPPNTNTTSYSMESPPSKTSSNQLEVQQLTVLNNNNNNLSSYLTHTNNNTNTSPTNISSHIQFGYSTANGWRDSMEDKISAVCPLKLLLPRHAQTQLVNTNTNNTDTTTSTTSNATSPEDTIITEEEIEVGLFCVCDGHGGSLTARYITENVATVFTTTFSELYSIERNKLNDTNNTTQPINNKNTNTNTNNNENSQVINKTLFNDNDNDDSTYILTDSFWQQLLTTVCATLENQLLNHPKMKLPTAASSYGKKSAKDSSGSTAVITLITATSLYIANVGDSRAVLGVMKTNNNNNNSPSTPITTSTTTSTTTTTVTSANNTKIIQSIPLTTDHKFHATESPLECARAEALGAK